MNAFLFPLFVNLELEGSSWESDATSKYSQLGGQRASRISALRGRLTKPLFNTSGRANNGMPNLWHCNIRTKTLSTHHILPSHSLFLHRSWTQLPDIPPISPHPTTRTHIPRIQTTHNIQVSHQLPKKQITQTPPSQPNQSKK